MSFDILSKDYPVVSTKIKQLTGPCSSGRSSPRCCGQKAKHGDHQTCDPGSHCCVTTTEGSHQSHLVLHLTHINMLWCSACVQCQLTFLLSLGSRAHRISASGRVGGSRMYMCPGCSSLLPCCWQGWIRQSWETEAVRVRTGGDHQV